MATRTYTGLGLDNLASNALNWSGLTAPVNGDAVVFADTFSTKDCTWDLSGLTLLSFDATAYTHTITFPNAITLTTTNQFRWAEATILQCVSPNASTINCGGDCGGTRPGPSSDLSGFTFNLTGSGEFFEFFNSSSTPGKLILAVGSSYTFTATGSLSMLADVYGTALMAAGGAGLGEWLFGHNSGEPVGTNDIRIKSTGRIGPGDSFSSSRFILGYSTRLLEMSGTFDANLQLYVPQTGFRIVGGNYSGKVLHIVAAGAINNPATLQFDAASTYHFSGTGSGSALVSENQLGGADPSFSWNIPSDTTLIVDMQTISGFQNADIGVMRFDWTGTGLCKFTGANAFTPSLTQMGNLEFSGGTPTLQDNLICTQLKISGGTFSAGGKNVTVSGNWTHTGGNYLASGLAGSTWTVGGNVVLSSTSANALNLNPSSGWTLALTAGTFTVSKARIKNLTVTGGTLIATNCVDDGGNNLNVHFVTSGTVFYKDIKVGTVKPASSLAGYPKLIQIVADADIAAALATDGGIDVTLADGTTQVPFGFYPQTNFASGTIIMRDLVDLSSSAATGDTMMRLRYGSPLITPAESKPTVAAADAFRMPMEEDPAWPDPGVPTAQMLDWKTNTNIGISRSTPTDQGTMSSVPGQVENAVHIAAGSYLDCGTFASMDGVSKLSIYGWLKRDADVTIAGFGRSSGTSDRVTLLWFSDNNVYAVINTGGGPVLAIAPLSGTGERHGLMVFDGTLLGNNRLKLYIDGAFAANASVGTPPATIPANAAVTFKVGFANTNNGQACAYDEVVMTLDALSADRIAYIFADESNNAATFSLGPQHTEGGGGGTLANMKLSLGIGIGL